MVSSRGMQPSWRGHARCGRRRRGLLLNKRHDRLHVAIAFLDDGGLLRRGTWFAYQYEYCKQVV